MKRKETNSARAVITIRFRANNDVNGNPRRIFAVLRRGKETHYYDEGYSGSGALPHRYRASYSGETYDITPSQYNALKKLEK